MSIIRVQKSGSDVEIATCLVEDAVERLEPRLGRLVAIDSLIAHLNELRAKAREELRVVRATRRASQ